MKHFLLINEPPLQVIPSLAVAIGLNEAIALQQVHFWLQNPRAGVVRDGFKWVHNTYEEWQETNFPFWSISTIKRVFLALEKEKYIISAQLDEKDREMRKYYRIDYEALDEVNLSRWNGSHRADVNRNTESQLPETDIFKRVALKISEACGGATNGMTAEFINTWMEKHEEKWIFEAIKIAVQNKINGGGVVKYVDKILIGWEANDYPLPREEKVKAAKKPNNQSILEEFATKE